MPRPPNPNNASRHGYQGSSFQPRRSFALTIPTVDQATFEAVQKFIRKRQPGLAHRAAWDQARFKSERIADEVQDLQERLVELNDEKDETIRDIQSAKDEQLERTLAKMEKKLRLEHERVQKEKDEEFSREMKATTDRQQKLRKEQENKRALNDLGADAGPPTKRPKLNSASENQDSMDIEKNSEENEKQESAAKREELKKAKNELDNLKETKSQMVWLLRQVITAEKKKKDRVKEESK